MEREVVSLVKMKCQPGGISLMPWKRAEVVNESKSIPQSMPAGRSRRSAAAVKSDKVDNVAAMIGFEYGLLSLLASTTTASVLRC